MNFGQTGDCETFACKVYIETSQKVKNNVDDKYAFISI